MGAPFQSIEEDISKRKFDWVEALSRCVEMTNIIYCVCNESQIKNNEFAKSILGEISEIFDRKMSWKTVITER